MVEIRLVMWLPANLKAQQDKTGWHAPAGLFYVLRLWVCAAIFGGLLIGLSVGLPCLVIKNKR